MHVPVPSNKENTVNTLCRLYKRLSQTQLDRDLLCKKLVRGELASLADQDRQIVFLLLGELLASEGHRDSHWQ